MNINFGRTHNGKSIEILIIKEPKYIDWLLNESTSPTSKMCDAQIEANRLIAKFDNMPFIEKCEVKNCNQTATRFVLYVGTLLGGSVHPSWWCDNCDPYDSGSSQNHLEILKSYKEAISYASSYKLTKSGWKSLIRDIFEAKGLPKTVNEARAIAFFQ